MSEAVLNDILELEDWTEYVGSLVIFAGDPDLIEAFDYNNVAQLTVGEYLALLDVAEAAILSINWDQLVTQLTAIINNPFLSDQFTQAEKDLILGALSTLDETDLVAGFDLIRDAFEGIPPDTLVVDAVDIAAGGGGSGGGGSAPGAGNDVVVGTEGSDDVDLGAGNDTFWAGPGDTGNDTVDGGPGNDVMGGGVGNDELNGDDGDDVIFGGVGADAITGGNGTDVAWAGNGDDTVSGGEGNDTIGGGAGADDLDGGAGNDLIYAGPDGAADTVNGGAGNDEIFGGAGDDVLMGGADDDVIYNGPGNDTVDGGDGDDTLWGGGGDDELTGGAGADEFAFAEGNGDDTVLDFNFADGDTLNLEDFDFADTAAALAAMNDVEGNVELSLGSGQVVTLVGVTVADFNADPDVLLI